MNNLKISRYADTEEAVLYGGYAINKFIEDNKNNPILLLVSGGSAMQLLEGINLALMSDNLTTTVVDERFSQDPKINNFAQLQKTDFYTQALEKDLAFIGTLPRPGENQEQTAERFEDSLRKWANENPQGKIIAILGMGTDGHTAGIMPFPENPTFFKKTFEAEKWIASYDASGKNHHALRLTSTITFLRQLDAAVVFIAGKDKQTAFEKLHKKQGSLEEIPANIFWQIRNLEIYTTLSPSHSQNPNQIQT